MISPRLLFLALVVCLLLWSGQSRCLAQDVIGYTAVLQSTNSREIDGYSGTETSYAVAYYYDAGVIGYLFDNSSQVDVKPAKGYVVAVAYPTTSSVNQGDTYTLYSEHYLIAYFYTAGYGYSNPYEYYPGAGFSPGDTGYAPGSSFTSGGGPVVVQQADIYLGYTYIQFTPAPPQISSISPKSVERGTSGTFNLQGPRIQDEFGVLTVRALNGDTLSIASSDHTTASLNFTIAADATVGAHQLTVSNTWGESEPVSFTVKYPSATVTGISPDTWIAGQSYPGVQITGTNFGSTPIVTLSDPTLSIGLPHNTSTSNGVSTTYVDISVPSATPSEPVIVTIIPGSNGSSFVQAPGGPSVSGSNTAFVIGAQQNACPDGIASDGRSAFSTIASTGLSIGGTGSMAVSFSHGSFNGFGMTVSYGPYSTPESIASHLASLITKQYVNSGLTAQAYGASILYKSSGTLGNVSFTALGSAFTAVPSPNSCPPVSIDLRLVPVMSVDETLPNGPQILHNVWRLIKLDGTAASPNYRVVEHIAIPKVRTYQTHQGRFLAILCNLLEIGDGLCDNRMV